MASEIKLSSSRAYILRALNDWICDNMLTPYVVIDAGVDGVDVPTEHVSSDGQVVLNISPSAVKDLVISNDLLAFQARFGGVPMPLSVPVRAVMAIYAKENGEGMVFGTEPGAPIDPDDDRSPSKTESAEVKPFGKRPSLKVVK